MGIWSGLAPQLANVTPLRPRPSQRGVISPWQSGQLAAVVAADIWGLKDRPLTKDELLRIPAVNKGRAILHAIISRPLRAYGQDGQPLDSTAQPTWLYRTNSASRVAPQTRTKLILDDFIFHDSSLLECKLGAPIADSPDRKNILDAWHVDYDSWSVTEAGLVEIDRGNGPQPVDQNTLIWIPGPGVGLLAAAGDVARGSARMRSAWVERVENPFPMMELHENEDTQMTDEEVGEWLQATVDARNAANGAFFTPYNIQAISHAGDTVDLFEDGRNAERIDWANFFNLPAALLDGSLSAASLTYSTQEGRRNELFDYTIPYWKDQLTARLSMDDITPAGTSIDMDFTDLLSALAPVAGPTEQD